MHLLNVLTRFNPALRLLNLEPKMVGNFIQKYMQEKLENKKKREKAGTNI